MLWVHGHRLVSQGVEGEMKKLSSAQRKVLEKMAEVRK